MLVSAPAVMCATDTHCKACEAAVGCLQATLAGSHRLLPYLSYTYTLCIYYIIVTDIYLKIISISYINYISEYIVYIKNKNMGIYP